MENKSLAAEETTGAAGGIWNSAGADPLDLHGFAPVKIRPKGPDTPRPGTRGSTTGTLYRRHLKACELHRRSSDIGRCLCPIWVDGRDASGKRIRVSLKTTNHEDALVLVGRYRSGPSAMSEAELGREILLAHQHCRDGSTVQDFVCRIVQIASAGAI